MLKGFSIAGPGDTDYLPDTVQFLTQSGEWLNRSLQVFELLYDTL